MYNQSILTRLLILTILVSSAGAGLLAQEEGRIIVISSRVGEIIDAQERQTYNLFPAIQGFKSAVFLKLSDSSHVLKITYVDEKTLQEEVKLIPQSSSRIWQQGEYIDHFEDIDADKYASSRPSQEDQAVQVRIPRITLSAGLRTLTVGGHLEAFFANGKMSAILGVGSIPPQSEDYSGWSKLVFTGALRYYFGELNSRPYIDLSFAPMAISTDKGPDYGRGLQIGYCFLADSGLTFNIGAGAGYALRNQLFGPTLLLDVGFTFR